MRLTRRRVVVVAVISLTVFGWSSTSAGVADWDELRLQLDRYLQAGQYRAAARLAAAAREQFEAGGDELGPGERASLVDMIVRDVLERRDWPGARTLPRPDAADETGEAQTLWYAHGVAAARRALAGTGPEMGLATTAADRLEAFVTREGRRGLAEIRRLGVRAALAASQEERDEMALLLEHAGALEDARLREEPSQPILPTHELAGDLWLDVDRYREAIREYQRAVEHHPGRARAHLGLARAAVKEGRPSLARRAYRAFLSAWREADADRPELSEARRYLSAGKD